jgi:cell division protein FtsQ
MSRVKQRARRAIDRPARWRLLLRRQRRLLRPALFVTACGLAMLGFVAGVQALGRGASFGERFGHLTAALGLDVHHVLVEGRQKTPPDLLRRALAIEQGDPLLTYSLAAARDRLERIEWVRSAEVRRVLPDTVVVELTERRPFAVWQHDGRFVLIDRDGNTVTDSDVAKFASQLPLLVGAGAPQAAAALIDALAGDPGILQHMQAAVRVGDRRWNLQMGSGASVMLPEGVAAQTQALATLVKLQAAHRLLDRPLAAIDLRLPDRLVILPQPQVPADPEDHSAIQSNRAEKGSPT